MTALTFGLMIFGVVLAVAFACIIGEAMQRRR